MFTIDDKEISGEGLTGRAREEARRRQMEMGSPCNGQRSSLDEGSAQRWAAAHRAFASAERFAVVGARLPPMSTMHGLMRRLARPIAKLILRAAQLVTREQTSFNVENLGALRALAEAVSLDVRRLEHDLAKARQELTTALEHDRQVVERDRQALERDRQALEQDRQERDVHLATLDRAAATNAQHAAAIETALCAWREESQARFEAVTRSALEVSERVRTELLVHERSIERFADVSGERARASTSASEDTAAADDELDHLHDAFYARFEDRFRGPRAEILARVSVYLPVVSEAGAGAPERPIVDLGSGRGEWLELLGEHGLSAKGVDLNFAMVRETKERGLDVVEADALTYLRGLADQSCGAVTAFHLVEHIPFAVVIKLIDEIVRVLQPGGVAILETPNPKNLVVGACTFFIDPTHRRPLHPDTMAFVTEARGLERIQVRFLHPVKEGLAQDAPGTASQLDEYLYGPQDFAVIGYRA